MTKKMSKAKLDARKKRLIEKFQPEFKIKEWKAKKWEEN